MDIRAACDVTAEDLEQMPPPELYEIYDQAREISHHYHMIAGAEHFAGRALRALKRRLMTDPSDVQAAIYAALLAYEAGQRNVCRSLNAGIPDLASDPTLLARHHYLAARLTSDLARAIRRLRQALSLDPGYAEASIALCEATMRDADRTENSEQVYNRAVEQGLSIVRQALEQNPTSTKMLNYLGIMQFGEDNRAAADCLLRSDALSPLNWLDLNILSGCLARSGDWEHAARLIPTIDLRKTEMEIALKIAAPEERDRSESEALYEIVRQAGRDASQSPADPEALAYLLSCVRLLDDRTHSGLASEISMDLEGRAKELLPVLLAKAEARLSGALGRAGLSHLGTALDTTPVTTAVRRPHVLFLVNPISTHSGH